jgi:hypothetical protein
MFLDEILLIVFSFLSFQDKKSISFVSRQFRRIAKQCLGYSLFIRTISGQLTSEAIDEHLFMKEDLTETIFWLCINDEIELLKLFVSFPYSSILNDVVFPKIISLMIAIGKNDIVEILGVKVVFSRYRERVFSTYTFEDLVLFKSRFEHNISRLNEYITKDKITMNDFL